MFILKIRAEIRTLLLIHKISWEVSGMIFYVISNPKFLLTFPSKFSTKYRTITNAFASFNNMTTLFYLCMTAWLTFRIRQISAFLILLGQHNQLFLQFHGHIFVKQNKQNWAKLKINLANLRPRKKMFQSIDLIVR